MFEVKQEVVMQSTSHTKFGDGEPSVQVHGMASKTEQISQTIGDQPTVQVRLLTLSFLFSCFFEKELNFLFFFLIALIIYCLKDVLEYKSQEL